MAEQQERDHSGTGSAALGMAVAAAIGATLGLIFAPKSGKELRKDLTKQAKQAAKKFKKTRAQVQEIVYSTFGQVNAELEQGYIELRAQILSMIEQLGSKAKLTQKKYDAMVEDVVDLYAKGKKWTDEAVKKLLKDLKAEWKHIKGESK
jgi:gas vesicle protein